MTIFTVFIGIVASRCIMTVMPAPTGGHYSKGLEILDPVDQLVHHRAIRWSDARPQRLLARPGPWLRVDGFHQFDQSSIHQAIHYTPDFQIVHVTGFGDLPNRVLRVDKGYHAPLFHAKLNILELLD